MGSELLDFNANGEVTMPSELTEKITRLRAAGDDASRDEAAKLEREAEKASRPRKRTATKDGAKSGAKSRGK